MLYGRAILVQRNDYREEDCITVEAEFSGYLGQTDFVPLKNKQQEDLKHCLVSRNMIKKIESHHTLFISVI